MMEPEPPPLEIRSYFVRNRNALLTRGDFSPLFVDYYLRLADTGQQPTPDVDRLLKEVVIGLCLHAAGRPHADVIAWTIHFENPVCNIFVTADNSVGKVIGTAFSDNVRIEGRNLLYCDVVASGVPRRRSVVQLKDTNGLAVAASFYEQSEQRPARLFCFKDEDFVFVSGQPDCDTEWLENLDDEAVRTMDRDEDLSLLETRHFRWECGCNEERMKQVLAGPMRSDPEGLFGEEDFLRMRCPRCGKPYTFTRKELESSLD